MSMYDENIDDGFDDEGGDQPEESNNRTFLLIAGGLGVLVLIGLCALAGYFFLGNSNAQQSQAETAVAVNTQQQATLDVGATQFSQSLAETQTAAVTFTVAPTNTLVVVVATETPVPTQNPATATVGAAFTQIAVSTQTVVPTSTALPNTGFADDVGIPGMFAMALVLVVVIFLARGLRTVPVK